MKYSTKTLRLAAITIFALLACLVGSALATPPPVTSLTWSGQSGAYTWSQADNWKGGAYSPSTDDNLGTLTFGDLGTTCNDSFSSDASCYFAENDLAGLSVDGIDLVDNAPYEMDGGTITLGSGGITATLGPKSLADAFIAQRGVKAAVKAQLRERPFASPRASISSLDADQATFELPFVLAAPQTWSIAGGGLRAFGTGLDVSSISGGQPLTIKLSNSALLTADGSIDAGDLAITGKGTVSAGGSVNANGFPVTVKSDASLDVSGAASASGPIDLESGAFLDIGSGISPEPTLASNGAVTLGSGTTTRLNIDEPGAAPSTDFSQLTATGDLDIAGGKLGLFQGETAAHGCDSLRVGDVDTLLKTPVNLTGTFTNAPDGATVNIKNECDVAFANATAVIHYTSDSVTARIKTSGDAGLVPVVTKKPKLLGQPEIGHTLTVNHGSWTNKPTSYRYDWIRCSLKVGKCFRLKKITGSSYALKQADLHSIVFVEVTARNKYGESASPAFEFSPVKRATTAQIKQELNRVIESSHSKSALGAIAKGHGPKFTVTTPAAGKLKLTWTARSGGKVITVASGLVHADKSATKKLKLKLTAAGESLLASSKLSLKATASFTPTGRNTVDVSKRVRLG